MRPRGLEPIRLLPPWDSPGKNTGVGCYFLLQGIFLTQGSNPGLPHGKQMPYPLSLNRRQNPNYGKFDPLQAPQPLDHPPSWQRPCRSPDWVCKDARLSALRCPHPAKSQWGPQPRRLNRTKLAWRYRGFGAEARVAHRSYTRTAARRPCWRNRLKRRVLVPGLTSLLRCPFLERRSLTAPVSPVPSESRVPGQADPAEARLHPPRFSAPQGWLLPVRSLNRVYWDHPRGKNTDPVSLPPSTSSGPQESQAHSPLNVYAC